MTTNTLIDGITIGADPELFILDTSTNEFVCPDGLIPGTKEEPYAVEYGAVQQDGFAAEFNIDPVDNLHDFQRNIKQVRKQLQGMLPTGLKLVAVPTATFSESEWERASDATKELGCSPDYNAWALRVNPPAKAEDRVRCAGGHIHFGWTNNTTPDNKEYFKSCVDLVRQLDWHLGAWSVTKDRDALRRSMYGKAGSMRFKPYGVEYRTLSNFWLKDHLTIDQTWGRLCCALARMKDTHYPTQQATYNMSLIKAINNSDLDEQVFDQFTSSPIFRS